MWNASSIEKTQSTFESLFQYSEKQNIFKENLLLQLVKNIPSISQINVNNQLTANQETTVKIENNLELNIELSSLANELEKSINESTKHIIAPIIEEIQEIKKELKSQKNTEATKSRIKKVVGILGKLIDYGIQNYDKIIKIGEGISKIF